MLGECQGTWGCRSKHRCSQMWNDASCEVFYLSIYCMTEEAAGNRWKKILIFPKSNFPNQSLSVFHFGLLGILWKNYFKKKIYIFHGRKLLSSLCFTIGVKGWKILPHELEMEKTRIETFWVTVRTRMKCMLFAVYLYVIPLAYCITPHSSYFWPEAK